jgi:hypothetical protein
MTEAPIAIHQSNIDLTPPTRYQRYTTTPISAALFFSDRTKWIAAYPSADQLLDVELGWISEQDYIHESNDVASCVFSGISSTTVGI